MVELLALEFSVYCRDRLNRKSCLTTAQKKRPLKCVFKLALFVSKRKSLTTAFMAALITELI